MEQFLTFFPVCRPFSPFYPKIPRIRLPQGYAQRVLPVLFSASYAGPGVLRQAYSV